MQPGYWLNDDSRTFLSRGYLLPGQSAEERIGIIAKAAERYLKEMAQGEYAKARFDGFADKFYGYMMNGWISLASPVWSNFGCDRGLPISCNGSYFSDTIPSILLKSAEIGMMTKLGAGTSAYLGALRPRGAAVSGGGTSSGPAHFCELIQPEVNVISQSNVRRGNCAVYIDIDHPDAPELLEFREEGNPIQHLSIGLCVSDAWMESMIAGDKDKRKLWARVIRKRFESGYPYIVWTDTMNNAAPQVYKDKGMRIWASNLCTEIANASSPDESFVCDLSSTNDLHFDDWKGTDLIQTLTFFLDAVMQEYIDKIEAMDQDAKFLMQAPLNFAKRQRSLGIGRLGWHSFLQSRMVPFDSFDARKVNVEIQRHQFNQSLVASQQMAVDFGEPDLLKGYGVRNVTRLAIAPTTSSSFILGQVSPSIEPQNSNYYVKDLAKGKFTYKNPYLEGLLEDKGQNTREIWESVLIRGGSVQHLDFLSDDEKDVFKTFGEIDQMAIVRQAADRQLYLDQAQSINLMIHPDTPPKDVNSLMIEAWRMGLKSLYYQRSTNPAQEYVRELLSCAACEA